jgi:hypothetical protein
MDSFSRHRESRHRETKCSFRLVDKNKLPFAEYHFKYRSMGQCNSAGQARMEEIADRYHSGTQIILHNSQRAHASSTAA